jgi:hypothetical protein
MVERKKMQSAIGIRVKTGWATVVLLGGDPRSPSAMDRQVIELCDPAIPESRQPWHAAEELPEAEGKKVIERLKKVVVRTTNQAIKKVITNYRDSGKEIRGVCLVVGSDIDPLALKNAHIRAHAFEGRLYRTAIEDALKSFGLSCSILVERNAYSKAAGILKRSEADLKRLIAGLGVSLKGPWRADEKMASLAAWTSLS